jgi:hypothetical protein
VVASTAAIPRDINPVFNATLVLTGLPGEHRLELRLKDIGMMVQEHFGGRLGPMIIAMCSLPTGEDISGFVDLVPVREVAGNGVPVLQLMARFREVGGLLGNTAALVEHWSASGPLPEPEAEAMHAELSSGVPGPSREQALTSMAPDMVAVQAREGQQRSSGVQAPLCSGGLAARFAISEAVFDFPRRVMKKLLHLQHFGERGPFIAAPLLTYDVLGCGYEVVEDTYCYFWEGMEERCLPPELDVVLEQFSRFAQTEAATSCSGVPAILRFLKATKEPAHHCSRCHKSFVVSSSRSLSLSLSRASQLCSSCGHSRQAVMLL